MSLPEINKRDSANAECKKFKPLTDREAEVYCIGLERGFEQAKKLMLAKIESMLRIARDYQKTTNNQGEALAEIQTLEELEGELK